MTRNVILRNSVPRPTATIVAAHLTRCQRRARVILMETTDTPTVKDLIEEAITIIEDRIGGKTEADSDQMVLAFLNDAHLSIRALDS